MQIRKYAAVALLLAMAAMDPSSARQPSQASSLFDQGISSALAGNHVTSVSFAQIRRGRIVRVAAYGLQDEHVRATPQTLYNIASLTKPLTAEVILRLASRGRLSLDEPMDKAWIDPDLAQDPRHSRLTPRLALTHQTGLPNWRAKSGLAFASDPGAVWSYSGEGFQYVARFAESRTGQPLDRLADRYLFGPLGMKDTSYLAKPWFKGRIAVPTDADGKWLEPGMAQRANAADLVYSTARDYAAFMLAVLADKGLSKDIARQRSTSQVSLMDVACKGKHAETCPRLVGFGLGWQLMDFSGETVLMHTGKDEGTFSFAYLNRASGDGVVILTNSDVGYRIVLPVLEQTQANPAFLRFLRGQMD